MALVLYHPFRYFMQRRGCSLNQHTATRSRSRVHRGFSQVWRRLAFPLYFNLEYQCQMVPLPWIHTSSERACTVHDVLQVGGVCIVTRRRTRAVGWVPMDSTSFTTPPSAVPALQDNRRTEDPTHRHPRRGVAAQQLNVGDSFLSSTPRVPPTTAALSPRIPSMFSIRGG